MASPGIISILDQIAWSYANLARAHAALSDGRTSYIQIDHIIRSRLFHGLISGKMSIRSLYEDERLKILSEQKCAYCDSKSNLSIDHVIPRIRGGNDDGTNLILSCRKCNSSKSGYDLLEWFEKRNAFPPLMILRRYLKIAFDHCDRFNFLEMDVASSPSLDLPFRLDLLPLHYPPLADLRL